MNAEVPADLSGVGRLVGAVPLFWWPVWTGCTLITVYGGLLLIESSCHCQLGTIRPHTQMSSLPVLIMRRFRKKKKKKERKWHSATFTCMETGDVQAEGWAPVLVRRWNGGGGGMFLHLLEINEDE